MSNSACTIPNNFGTAKFSNNSRVQASGANNEGNVTGNSNSTLNASRCRLNLRNNSNTRIQSVDANLNIASCSNTHISGNGGALQLKNNSNAVIAGDGNRVEACNNSNLRLTGDNNKFLQLVRNSNFNVTTNRSTITAEDTSNASIFGEGATVSLKNVQNHGLRQVQRPASKKIEWKLPAVTGISNSAFVGHVGVRVGIDFSEEASIDKGKYKVDAFNFSVQVTSPITLEVEFGEEHDNLTVDSVGSLHVTLSTVKDGEKQALTMIAPLIKQDEGSKPKIKFTINLQPPPPPECQSNSGPGIQSDYSNLTIDNCQVVQISGKGGSIQLRNIFNAMLAGDGNHVEACNNSNLNLTGNNNRILRLLNNTNFNATTNRSTITAEATSNICIFGEGATIYLRNVLNHRLRQVQQRPPSSKIEWKIVNPNMNVGCVDINFSEEASIDHGKYKVDAFNFSTQLTSATTLDVQFGEDHDNLALDSVSSSLVTLSTFKGGEKHTLTMMAPWIKHDEGRKPVVKLTISVQPPS